MRETIIDERHCEDGALPAIYEVEVSKRYDGSVLLEYLIPDRHLVSQIYYGYSVDYALKDFHKLIIKEEHRYV